MTEVLRAELSWFNNLSFDLWTWTCHSASINFFFFLIWKKVGRVIPVLPIIRYKSFCLPSTVTPLPVLLVCECSRSGVGEENSFDIKSCSLQINKRLLRKNVKVCSPLEKKHNKLLAVRTLNTFVHPQGVKYSFCPYRWQVAAEREVNMRNYETSKAESWVQSKPFTKETLNESWKVSKNISAYRVLTIH